MAVFPLGNVVVLDYTLFSSCGISPKAPGIQVTPSFMCLDRGHTPGDSLGYLGRIRIQIFGLRLLGHGCDMHGHSCLESLVAHGGSMLMDRVTEIEGDVERLCRVEDSKA